MYGIQTEASNTYSELLEEEEISAPSLALSRVCHVGVSTNAEPGRRLPEGEFDQNKRQTHVSVNGVSSAH